MMNFSDENFTLDNEYAITEARFTRLINTIQLVQLTQVVLITCTNLLVFFLFYKMKSKKKKSIPNFLLFMQSVTDLYIACMMWFELITELTMKDSIVFRNNAVHIFTGLLEYSLTLSLGTLFLGSFERYLAIVRPYFHKCHVRMSRIMYATLCVWVLSSIPPTIYVGMIKSSEKTGDASNVVTYSITFDAVMFCLILTAVVLLFLTFQNANLSCQEQKRIRRRLHSKLAAHKKLVRLTLIFLIMISIYTFSFLPIAIHRVLSDSLILGNLSSYDNILLISVCHILYKGSALCNPFLTVFIKEDFRAPLIECFNKRKVRFSDQITYHNSSKTITIKTDS